MIMAKSKVQPSRFYRVTMLIEVPDGHSLYVVDGETERLVERFVEKAVDNNTGMLAHGESIEAADAPDWA